MKHHINNHIHTTFSFSPYTPTQAVEAAKKNGLQTAGIMDHDSVGGLREFIQAGKDLNIAVTVGFELRVDFSDTPFAGGRINNPDQDTAVYLAMHGIPHDQIDRAEAFLKPYREKRNARNRAMTKKLDAFVRKAGLEIDFNRDVISLSQWEKGGSVTERHICCALAQKIMDKYPPGPSVVTMLEERFGIKVNGKSLEKLNDPNEQWYRYYLLGVLKSHMVAHFYIDATDELPHYSAFIQLAEEIGAIPAYAYLGDVGDSVTGDKRTQKFEDAYLDELVAFLKKVGFKAITYMPARNTKEQLARLMKLCREHGIFEICGEDINSPFQPFVCDALALPEYGHLITAAWALIGHERSARGEGLFSPAMIEKYPSLEERVKYFADMGKK